MGKRTYVPSMVDNVHELTIYLTRYNSRILAALAIIDAGAIPAYEGFYASLLALDALKETLAPLLP